MQNDEFFEMVFGQQIMEKTIKNFCFRYILPVWNQTELQPTGTETAACQTDLDRTAGFLIYGEQPFVDLPETTSGSTTGTS